METSGTDFLKKCDYNLYLVKGVTEAQRATINSNLNQFVEEGFLYETLFNKKMYTFDQIACEESAIPVMDFYTYMESYEAALDEALDFRLYSV